MTPRNGIDDIAASDGELLLVEQPAIDLLAFRQR
jgi:hypothetical protein